ncbi:MAG: RagB/SusD family nutrient uptake outer membrane protein [Bacteroidales bacterium]|nr:RagB/SusD family nutrient uptake outer membrane protein [Bacteroidales bacterium]
MKIKNLYMIPLLAAGLMTACDDMFEPAIENNSELESVYDSPKRLQGLIGQVYSIVGSVYQTSPNSDLATDDIISNQDGSGAKVMATGGWTSQYNLVSNWNSCYDAIHYCNLVIDVIDKVTFVEADPVANKMFADHFKAEALAYRALFHFKALEAHAGYVGGTLMGIPIHDKLETEGNYIQTRSSFTDCVNFIMNDFTEALKYLPYEFAEYKTQESVPANLVEAYKKDNGEVDLTLINRVYGKHNFGKINGKIVEAVKSQFELMIASPAYQDANTGYTWENAAKDAYLVLQHANKGPNNLDKEGFFWYDDSKVKDFKRAEEIHNELLWHDFNDGESNSMEKTSFPPSLYGNGNLNPTQNLVDAFPMANGYPISDEVNSNYDPENPFANRDPRLAKYIVYNGNTIGNKNTAISVVMPQEGEKNIDANNQENNKSTRTGYYLKKLLRSSVNLDPSNSTTQKHLGARIRYTEILLNYAEAANEVAGPKGLVGDADFSAYDAIKAIRARAGITDVAYLDECATDKDKFRELIRNERRLELCFENHRFWDLRRWKVDLSKLNEPAKGLVITKNADQTLSYKTIDVEERGYKDYQYYGPIPYGECVKFPELQQNQGW